MASVATLMSVYSRLNESNRFDVLVYARLKVALQMAAGCRPRVIERRKARKYLHVHWVM